MEMTGQNLRIFGQTAKHGSRAQCATTATKIVITRQHQEAAKPERKAEKEATIDLKYRRNYAKKFY
jgi:hypothetical protein